MRAVVVTPPDIDAAVPLATVIEHCKADGAGDDALLGIYRDAAFASLDGPDGWLGRALYAQSIKLYIHRFDWNAVALPYPPVARVGEITYRDDLGVTQTVDPATYEVINGRLFTAFGKVWPRSSWTGRESIEITYAAGYDTLPKPIVAAILLMTNDLYSNRGTTAAGVVSAVPMSTRVENLLTPFRVYG